MKSLVLVAAALLGLGGFGIVNAFSTSESEAKPACCDCCTDCSCEACLCEEAGCTGDCCNGGECLAGCCNSGSTCSESCCQK